MVSLSLKRHPQYCLCSYEEFFLFFKVEPPSSTPPSIIASALKCLVLFIMRIFRFSLFRWINSSQSTHLSPHLNKENEIKWESEPHVSFMLELHNVETTKVNNHKCNNYLASLYIWVQTIVLQSILICENLLKVIWYKS